VFTRTIECTLINIKKDKIFVQRKFISHLTTRSIGEICIVAAYPTGFTIVRKVMDGLASDALDNPICNWTPDTSIPNVAPFVPYVIVDALVVPTYHKIGISTFILSHVITLSLA
jgi:hypothetical protein